MPSAFSMLVVRLFLVVTLFRDYTAQCYARPNPIQTQRGSHMDFGRASKRRWTRTVTLFFASVIALVFAVPSPAGAPYWEKRDWTKWSWSECSQLLGALPSSPWARPEGTSMGGYRETFYYSQTIQFRSALPVRLALARMEQLNLKYDKMNPAEQRDLDQKIQTEFLANPPADLILIHVVNKASATGQNPPPTEAEDPRACAINLGDGRDFVSSDPQSIKRKEGIVEYDVTFPRFDKGQPIIKATDTKFVIACGPEVQFNASKMIFKGKLEY